jgi:perosamine synthetase
MSLDALEKNKSMCLQSLLMWVDLYGNIGNRDRIAEICTKKKITFCEDACESLGGTWKGKKAGTFGQAAAFSFYGNKTITTGEGGMLVTDRADIYEKAKLLRGQGQMFQYYHTEVGYNYRMTSLQAALGLAQLGRIKEIMEEKERVFERYKNRLDQSVTFASEHANSEHSKWAVTIYSPCKDRIQKALEKAKIETRRVFHPVSSMPAYQHLCRHTLDTFEISQRISDNGLTLPSYPELKNKDIDQICDIVLRAVLKR